MQVLLIKTDIVSMSVLRVIVVSRSILRMTFLYYKSWFKWLSKCCVNSAGKDLLWGWWHFRICYLFLVITQCSLKNKFYQLLMFVFFLEKVKICSGFRIIQWVFLDRFVYVSKILVSAFLLLWKLAEEVFGRVVKSCDVRKQGALNWLSRIMYVLNKIGTYNYSCYVFDHNKYWSTFCVWL